MKKRRTREDRRAGLSETCQSPAGVGHSYPTKRVRFGLIFGCLLALFFSSAAIAGRTALTRKLTTNLQKSVAATPAFCSVFHHIGNMVLEVSNDGGMGTGWPTPDFYDCFTGYSTTIGCEFPKGSGLSYQWGSSFWVGTVIGNDALVSHGGDYPYLGVELNPDVSPSGDMIFRSTLDPEAPEYEGAVSEEDWIAVYTDTFTDLPWITRDAANPRKHLPLPIEITQKTYAWSYQYAEDFVLFDLSITNLGFRYLHDVYFGVSVAHDVGFVSGGPYDDITGFLRTSRSSVFGSECSFVDTVNIAWSADNDGDPFNGEFVNHVVTDPGGGALKSIPHVTGLKYLGIQSKLASGEYINSYSWWTHAWPTLEKYGFGPRRNNESRDFLSDGIGYPRGDANKLFVMSGGDIDYDQIYTAVIRPDDPNWRYPDQSIAGDISDGQDSDYLYAFGPFEIPPGASFPVAFAYIGGENLHTDPNNIDNLPNNPDAFYNNLDFSDLVKNATWAEWIYDNPGIDSDGDGYFGKFRVCVTDSVDTDSGWVVTKADTRYYEGDGVPDWRAAGPPPAPYVWVEATVNGLLVRFNGERSEAEKDIFSNILDFEGYHIWLGRDDRESSYSLVASYDREDYDKYVWNEGNYPIPNFVLMDIPYSLNQLRCLYGGGIDHCNDSSFEPLRFTRGSPYRMVGFPDSVFYFEPHNFNASRLGQTSAIRKVYPNEPPPPQFINPDSLDPDRYTAEGHLKYYEYEFTIENLLASIPYWVNVTDYDFGSPASGLAPLETSKTLNALSAYPYANDAQMTGQDKQVYVYPNPYRINAGYRRDGFEGRTREHLPNEKVRAINFTNLPAKCTISIFTIDGDLVREIKHDVDPSDPNYLHDEWNLVTRNRQAVVSGLYYWTIEDDAGNVQIGKLAIIM